MPDNHRARKLYRRAGFRRVAVVDGSWIMTLTLRRDEA
jgi:RimJ/RimL family protein N-acetyltransferase